MLPLPRGPSLTGTAGSASPGRLDASPRADASAEPGSTAAAPKPTPKSTPKPTPKSTPKSSPAREKQPAVPRSPAEGLTAAGLTTAGLTAAGLSTAGLTAAGLSTAGLSTAGLSTAGAMAAHHRIQALNKAWGEKRESRRQDAIPSDDSSSSTDSDSSSGDIVHEPLNRRLSMADIQAATSSAFAAPALRAAVARPLTPVAPVGLSAAPAARPESAPRVTETPVPLPEFARSSGHKMPLKPQTPIADAASMDSELRSHRRDQALRFTEEEVCRKFAQVQAQTKARAGDGQPKTQPKDQDGPGGGLKFATPAQLLARIRQSAADSPVPLPPKAKLGEKAPGPDKAGASTTDDSSGSEDYDDDVLMLDNESVFPDAPSLPDASKPDSPKPDAEVVYSHTVDGRPYTTVENADGVYETNRGIIIPTNYALRSESPRFPCPVRGCPMLLKHVVALSAHFAMKHRRCKFNDNCDGTLTYLAYYENTDGFSRAIVVSQNPLPPDAPSPAEPPLPHVQRVSDQRPSTQKLGKRKYDDMGTRVSSPAPKADSPFIESDIPSPHPLISTPTQACRYIQSILSSKQHIPNRVDVNIMIHLRQRRNLPQAWINHHRGSTLHPTFYAIALAYVVGVEVRGLKACTQTKRSHLSGPCVALPNEVSGQAMRTFSRMTTCVGCFYRSNVTRQRNCCDWGEADLRDEPSPAQAEPDKNGDPVGGEQSQPRAPARTRGLRVRREATVAESQDAASSRKLLGAADEPGNGAEALLEMEAWEMAPGRLTDESGEENIAFSGPFLINSAPIQALPDIGVHVVVAKPGSSTRWAVEEGRVRVCLVAAGKIRVTTGETTFVLGRHGGFHVKAGQTCLVENRFYVEAVVHCVTVTQ